MSPVRSAITLALLLGFRVATAPAQGTLTVSGNPGTMTVSTAVAGNAPDPVTEGSTTYTLVDVTTVSRITARVDAPLPTGVVLKVTLAAPTGAVSSGAVSLSTVEQDVVRLIPIGSYSGLAITYQLSATSAAGVLPLTGPVVTFTAKSDP
jgi:hypothetical protein